MGAELELRIAGRRPVSLDVSRKSSVFLIQQLLARVPPLCQRVALHKERRNSTSR